MKVTTQRPITLDEAVAEMDRRGTVIEQLEARIQSLMDEHKAEVERLREITKTISDALLTVRPMGGSEMFRKYGDAYYADPDYCRDLIKADRDALHNARINAVNQQKRRQEAEAELAALQSQPGEKEPDYCFNHDDWEYTWPWENRNDVGDDLSLGEVISLGDVIRVGTLFKGPDKWLAVVPVTFDENGTADETALRWFDTEAEAKAALSSLGEDAK